MVATPTRCNCVALLMSRRNRSADNVTVLDASALAKPDALSQSSKAERLGIHHVWFLNRSGPRTGSAASGPAYLVETGVGCDRCDEYSAADGA